MVETLQALIVVLGMIVSVGVAALIMSLIVMGLMSIRLEVTKMRHDTRRYRD